MSTYNQEYTTSTAPYASIPLDIDWLSDPTARQIFTLASGTQFENILYVNSSQDAANSSEEIVEQNKERNEDIVVWEITTLVIIFVLTVFGNVLVMVLLMIRRKKLTRMCYFILSLCVSDLITALMNVLPQIAWEITHRFRGGDFLCRAVKFGQILGPYLSSYLLVVTALDRYLAICYPLSNCSWTPRHAKNMILVASFLSLACCIPQLFIFRYQEIHNGQWECWASFAQYWGARAYVTWYVLSVFIIPLIILIVVYSSICRCLYVNFKLKQPDEKPKPKMRESRRPNLLVNLRQHRWTNQDNVQTKVQKEPLTDSRSYPSTSKSPNHETSASLLNGPHFSLRRSHNSMTTPIAPKTRSNPRVHSVRGISRAKIKTVKLTVTVIACYITCSMPFSVAQLWSVWDENATKSPFYSGATFAIVTLLASLNSVVNPWIFLAFNENISKVLKNLCLCHVECPRRSCSRNGTKDFRLTIFTTEGPEQTSGREHSPCVSTVVNSTTD